MRSLVCKRALSADADTSAARSMVPGAASRVARHGKNIFFIADEELERRLKLFINSFLVEGKGVALVKKTFIASICPSKPEEVDKLLLMTTLPTRIQISFLPERKASV